MRHTCLHNVSTCFMLIFKPVLLLIVYEVLQRAWTYIFQIPSKLFIYFIFFIPFIWQRRCNFKSTTFKNNEYFHQTHIRIIGFKMHARVKQKMKNSGFAELKNSQNTTHFLYVRFTMLPGCRRASHMLLRWLVQMQMIDLRKTYLKRDQA
jgi:hypothetical protein